MKAYIGPFKKDTDQRKIEIRIDKYDTWNMESTLAYIILPMLKQLKATMHGSPGDLIEFQQTSNSAQYSFDFYEEDDKLAWEKGHEHWHEILDKMIWSFEQINTDWEAQFHSGEHDVYFEEVEGTEHSIMKYGPNDTHKFDAEGYSKFQDRMQEGFELFGKYYRNLWD
jgi:hypothetical protein